MSEYPILQQNKPIGTLRVTREGLHTVFPRGENGCAPAAACRVRGALARVSRSDAAGRSGALTLQKRLTRLECARLPQEILFAADEAWDIPSEPEHEPEPEPQGADDGLDVLWYSAPDGVLTTFDGKRTVIAIPADAPNLPRGAQAVLREIDGRPYLIFPR